MRVANEKKEIADSLKGIGDAVSGVFDPAKREAAKIVRDAERKAAEKVARAQAKVAAAEAKAAAKAVIAEAKAAAKAIKGGTVQAAQIVAKTGILSEIGNFIAVPFKASAKAGLRVVEQPIALAMKPLKWGSQGLSKAFTSAPKTAMGVTAALAAAGIGSWWSRHKAANLQNEYMTQAMTAEALAAQAPPQQSYKNVVSHDAVDARIAADRAAQATQTGQAVGGHAAKVMANQAAAAQAANKPTADLAAL